MKPEVRTPVPSSRTRVYLYLLGAWILAVLAVGIPWLCFESSSLGDPILALFVSFPAIYVALYLAVRAYVRARDSNFRWIKICAGISAWLVFAICGLYTAYMIWLVIHMLNEYLYFNFG